MPYRPLFVGKIPISGNVEDPRVEAAHRMPIDKLIQQLTTLENEDDNLKRKLSVMQDDKAIILQVLQVRKSEVSDQIKNLERCLDKIEEISRLRPAVKASQPYTGPATPTKI